MQIEGAYIAEAMKLRENVESKEDLLVFPFSYFLILWDSGLRAGLSGIRVPAETGNTSLQQRVQTGSEIHPASYPMSTSVPFSWVKAAGA
jgi:hypothetical protein